MSLDGQAVVDAVVQQDGRIVYIKAGHIVVSQDEAVSIIDEADGEEYLVDADLAATFVVPREPQVQVMDLGELYESHSACKRVIELLCGLPRSRELPPLPPPPPI